LVLALVFPTLFQLVFVKPNELQLEKPYIQRNIDLTQQTYISIRLCSAGKGLTDSSDLGQLPCAVRSRQWGGDESARPQDRRRVTDPLPRRHLPVATGSPPIDEPRIDFGEETDT